MSDLYQRKNPHRLYRDREHAIIAGVCAGIAEYFGFNRRAFRIIVGIATVMFLPFVVVSYFILVILLPVKPVEPKIDEQHATFWRGVYSELSPQGFNPLLHRSETEAC